MAATTRPPSSRTPPFILVGLLVLVCVLAYNYWSLSSTSANLVSQVETLTEESNTMKSKRDETESKLQLAQEEKGKVQASLDETKVALQNSESSLNSVKAEVAKLKEDATGCQEKIRACDEDLKTVKAELETVKGEKEALVNQNEKGMTKVCAAGDCIGPIKDFVKAAAQILTAEQMATILGQSSLDAKALLDGVEFAKPQVQSAQVQQQPVAIQNNAGVPQVNENIVKMEMDGAGRPVSEQPDAPHVHTSSTDKNNNVTKKSHDQSNEAKDVTKENTNRKVETENKEENKNATKMVVEVKETDKKQDLKTTASPKIAEFKTEALQTNVHVKEE